MTMPTIENGDEAVRKTRVLSLELAALGNKVFGESLRAGFADSDAIDFTARWSNDDGELHAKVLDQILRVHSPIPYMRKHNLDFRRVRSELGYSYKTRRLLQRLVPVGAYDVLHFHTQSLTLLATDFIRRMPTVITTDQSGPQMSREKDPRFRYTHVLSERLESAPLRAAAFVVVFSQWAANSMIAEHGLSPDRVRIIPIGIDLDQLSDLSAFAVPKVSRRKRILFVGGDYVRKGGPLLVDVFLQRFASRDVELHLVTGEKNIPDHPQIIVHRGVSALSPKWKELYANADVFAVPTYWDAFGIAYIEAMAAGVPVIGTNISAGPEIIAAGETGFLIERGDARKLGDDLEALLFDDELRERFGRNGVARAARLFDARHTTRALGELFREAAASGKAPKPSATAAPQ